VLTDARLYTSRHLRLRNFLKGYGTSKAAEAATRELNAAYLTVMLEGKYTDAYLKAAGKDAPKFDAADLKVIGEADFGTNVYRPTVYVLASDQAPGGSYCRETKPRARRPARMICNPSAT